MPIFTPERLLNDKPTLHSMQDLIASLFYTLIKLMDGQICSLLETINQSRENIQSQLLLWEGSDKGSFFTRQQGYNFHQITQDSY